MDIMVTNAKSSSSVLALLVVAQSTHLRHMDTEILQFVSNAQIMKFARKCSIAIM